MKGSIVGCGFFAQNHLQPWRDIEGVEIVALCDTDESRLLSTAQSFDIDQTY